jgi:heptosyltransferase II
MPRFLVVQLGRLGDAIQTTPLIESLREKHPGAEIEILVFEGSTAALQGMESVRIRTLREAGLPGQLSEIHAQIESDRAEGRASARELYEVFRQLALPAYDALFNCSYSPLAAWIAQQAVSKIRVGPTITGDGEVLFNHPAHVYLRARTHFRDQNWFNIVDLWRCTAGRAEPPNKCARPYIGAAKELPFGLPPKPSVALNPGSSDSQRRWPAGQFAALADRLALHGFRPVLVGAPSDVSTCAEVQARCSGVVTNVCGQTSVAQMALLLSEVELLVSNDTGAVHIASAVGCPVLGLFGASAYFAETSPWSEGNVILQGPLGQLGVSLDTGLAAAAALHCLGLAEEAQLSRELSAQGVLGWKTYFLPSNADEVGGLAYRSLHANGEDVETRFSRILRHLIAGSFFEQRRTERKNGQKPSVRERPKSSRAKAAISIGTIQWLDGIDSFVSSLDRMALSAARCGELSRQPSPAKAIEISARVQELNDGICRMKAAAESVPSVKPVVHFLDWQCRMLPPQNPLETFRAHEVEYRRARHLLSEAGKRLQIGPEGLERETQRRSRLGSGVRRSDLREPRAQFRGVRKLGEP